MQLNNTEITERIIAKANLSNDQKKVARHHYDLPAAGKKTREWVQALDSLRYRHLLRLAKNKIKETLQQKEGAGN